MVRVLIVEDDDNLRKLYGNQLRSNDYTVETAVNGEDALEKVSDFLPDIIILDILMPKMTGTEVLWNLKADPEYRDIPVIMLTASQENLKDCFEIGAKGYVIKGSGTSTDIIKWIKLLVG